MRQIVPRDICPICGAEFYCPPVRKRRARAVYCSRACRARAQIKLKNVRPVRSRRGRAAVQLAFDGRTLCAPPNLVERTCIGCGSNFKVHAAHVRLGGGQYCARKCYWKYQVQRRTYSPHPHVKGGHRSDLGIYFRSSWEANWARYLNWRKDRGEIKAWKFEPVTFEFPVKRGSRFYTPDFQITRLDDSIYYEEVKGFMDKKSQTKLKRMAKYHPQTKVLVIDAPLYRSAHKQLCGLIPNWEVRS